MKKTTLVAAMAAVAISASAQYQVDPSASLVINKGVEGATVEALFLDQSTINTFEAQGATVNTNGMINNETVNFWYWFGWTPGDGSYPGVDFQMDGYVAIDVAADAASGGWSGGGVNVGEGANWNTSNFCDDTRFHMGFRSSNPTSIGIILLDGGEIGSLPAKFTIASNGAAFVDNGVSFPIVGQFDEGGDWAGIDISFKDLKKLWPDFSPKATDNWLGNSLSVLSGNVPGKNFSLDATYFYTLASAGIEGVAADDSNAPAVYYNLQGVQVENPANGLYIVKQGNSAKKVLVK